MRPKNKLRQLGRKASPKPRLKASSTMASALGRSLASLSAVAAAWALGMWVAVPFAVFAMASAKAGPAAFSEAVAAYAETSLLTGWEVIGAIPGYGTPASILALLLTALAAALAACAVGEGMTPPALKNIFGPAASRGNEKGSARLFVNEHLLSLLTETWSGSWEDKPAYAAPIIGYSPTFGYYLAPPESHTVAFGVTGSGKTTSLNYCSLDALVAAGASVVVSDPKGELYNATGPDLRRRGVNVRLIDFRNPERSECINPLEPVIRAFEERRALSEASYAEAVRLAAESGVPLDEAGRSAAWPSPELYEGYRAAVCVGESEHAAAWSKAEEAALDLAGSIIPDRPDAGAAAHWEQVARILLQSLVLLVATYVEEDWRGEGRPYAEPLREQRTLETVYHLLSEYGGATDKGKQLEGVLRQIDGGHPAWKVFAQARNSEAREYRTAVSETIKFLSEVLSGSLNRILNRSDVSLSELGERQTVLYVVIPDERPMVGKLFTTIVTQAYQELIACASRSGGRTRTPVHFILEEVGNLAVPIPGLPQKLAMGRGYGIYFHLTLQDMEQLPARYGRGGQSTILSNCAVRMLIKTNDAQVTGRYFSENMGDYTYVSSRMTRSRTAMGLFDSSSSSSRSAEKRPVMFPDELTRWDPEWGTIVLMNKPGKAPGILARLAYGYQTMMPCVFPRESAWNTETAGNLGIGTREEMAAKAEAAQAESRAGDRTPNSVWEPRWLSAGERARLAESLVPGGVPQRAEEGLRRFAAARGAREYALSYIAARVSPGDLFGGGEDAIDSITAAMRKAYGDELRAEKEAASSDPGFDEEAADRGIRVRLAAAEGIAFEVLSRALADGDASALAAEADPEPAPALVERQAEPPGELPGPAPEEPPAPAAEERAEPRGRGKGWIDEVRAALKSALAGSSSLEEFVALAEAEGVVLVESKGGYSCRLKGTRHVIAASKVGRKYAKAALEKRFAAADA